MENNKTNTTQKKQKKSNAMQKIGKTIKDTFIEMSSSLAGWIEDTGNQFSGKKTTKKKPKNTSSPQAKLISSQPKSNA